MAKSVFIPGFGDVDFPDDMTDDAIVEAIERDILPQAPSVAAPAPPDASPGTTPPPAPPAPTRAAVVDPRLGALPGMSQADQSVSMRASATGRPVDPEAEALARSVGEEYRQALDTRPAGTMLTPADFASQKTGISRDMAPVQPQVMDPRLGSLPGMSQQATEPMRAASPDADNPLRQAAARGLREVGDVFESFQVSTTVPLASFISSKDYTTRLGEKVLQEADILQQRGALREAKARAATGASLRDEDRQALEADEFLNQMHAAFQALREQPWDETVQGIIVDLIENSPTYIATSPLGSGFARAARQAIKTGENAQRLANASARLPALRRFARGMADDVAAGVAAGVIMTEGEYTPAQAVQDAVAGGFMQLGSTVLSKIKSGKPLEPRELAEVIRAVDAADIDVRPELEEALAPLLTQDVRDQVIPAPRDVPPAERAPDAPPPGMFDDAPPPPEPPPESPRVRSPTEKMEEQRRRLFEKRAGSRKRSTARFGDLGELPEGARDYRFYGNDALSSLIGKNGEIALYYRDFGALRLLKDKGEGVDFDAARKVFGKRKIRLIPEEKPIKSRLEKLAERFNEERVNPLSRDGVTEYWIPPEEKWADIDMDAYAGLNADDVAAAIIDRPRGKRAEKVGKMEAYARSPEGRAESEYAEHISRLRELEEQGDIKQNENGSYTAFSKDAAEFLGTGVYFNEVGDLVDAETGGIIHASSVGADFTGEEIASQFVPAVVGGRGVAPAGLAPEAPAAAAAGGAGSPPREPPRGSRAAGMEDEPFGQGPKGRGGRSARAPGDGVGRQEPPYIPGDERDSPGDKLRPRIDRDVDELRARDASLGIYDRILDRDVKQRWTSLDERARRIAETWSLEDFKNQMDRGALDQYELDAANARMSYARLKEAEANTEFLKASVLGDADARMRAQAALLAAKIETSAFQTMFLNAKTQTGRMLAVLRRLKQAIGEKGVSPDDDFLKKAMREMDLTPEQADEMLRVFKDSPEDFDSVLRGFLKFSNWDKFRYWYKAGLLSAIPTQLRNIIGTAAEVPIVPLEAAAASPFDWMLSKFDGTGTRTRFAGEALEQFRGSLQALPEAMKSFVEKQKGIAKLESPAFNPNKRFDHQLSPFKGKVGNLLSVPFRELEVFDDLGQELGNAAGMGALVYRKSKQTGVPVEQIRAEMASNPEKHADIFRGAREFGERLTFQEKTTGKLGDLIKLANKAEKQGGLGGLLVLQTVPFKKTPSNVINRLMERSPIGYASAAKQLRAWQKLASKVDAEVRALRAGGASKEKIDALMQKYMPDLLETRGAAADALSRATIGSAMLGGFLALGYAGFLTGGEPKDEKTRLALQGTGWQPYSLTWEGADGVRHYIPINRLGGSFVPMLIAAADFTANQDDAAANKLWAATKAFARGMTEQPFLQGVHDIAELLDGITSGQEGPIARWASNALVTSAIPNIVASAGRASDPLKRNTKPTQEGFPGFVERTVNVAKSRLPGLSETLPAQISPTGEPVPKPGSSFAERFLSPAAASSSAPDDVAAELARVDEQLPENFKGSAVPSIPSRTMTLDNVAYDLLPEEYDLLMQARREATEEMAKQIRDPQWEALTPEQKAEFSKEVYSIYMSFYREMVKTMVEMRTQGAP